MLKVKNSISAVQVVFWQIRLWKLRCVELKTFLKNFLILKGMFENLFSPATLLRKRISYRNFPKYFVYFLNFFRTAIFNTGGWHCVHSPSPSPPFCKGRRGGGCTSYQIFKKEETWHNLNYWRGFAGKEGVTFLRKGIATFR